MRLRFPKNFLWGAASSSHQVEGNNRTNDWWQWEASDKTKDKSGKATRHYELFKEDFKLAASLNHNCHRFSIEWSRIEPTAGNFNQKEINHYKEVIRSLKENNLEPVATLHHFTNPKWFSDLGGWARNDAPDYFLKYAKKIISELGKEIKYWVTINEPMVYVYNSYYLGIWPPGGKKLFKAFRVKNNLINAHIKAYKLIHRIHLENNWQRPYVSIADNLRIFIPCKFNFLSVVPTFFRHRAYETLNYLVKAKSLDFVGVNYYAPDFITFKFNNLFGINCENSNHHHVKERSSFGWPIYPEGLFRILMRIKKYNLPILITENGIYAKDDELRWQFIAAHLVWLKKAMDSGVNVLGYIYWSLMDNFEWDFGFGPKFGLVEIDYNSFKRMPRQSAYNFANLIKNEQE